MGLRGGKMGVYEERAAGNGKVKNWGERGKILDRREGELEDYD